MNCGTSNPTLSVPNLDTSKRPSVDLRVLSQTFRRSSLAKSTKPKGVYMMTVKP